MNLPEPTDKKRSVQYAKYENNSCYNRNSNVGFKFIFRPGHTFKVSLKIKDDRVHGFPDARFIASSSQKTIAVTEVFHRYKYTLKTSK